MKVLQINSVCGIRSTGRICTDIAETLSKQGDSSIIAFGREDVPEKYRGISHRISSDIDVKISALSSRIFDNMGFKSKKATERFVDWIKEYDPDIIHLHNIHGYYINIEILFNYLKSTGKPVIWTLHDCWAFTGHCCHFSYAGCDKWKTGCHDCPQKSEYPKSMLADRSRFNFFKKKEIFKGLKNLTIVTPSNWLAEKVRESFLGEYPVVAIPNGIDLSLFKPTSGDFVQKNNLSGKKIILGVASVWNNRKGLEDFISLSKKIDDNKKIVLVGLNKSQIADLPDNIIGIERTNNIGELADIYTSAFVFVNPSREETMGLTTVEAMACGTPVIVYNATAVPEVVDDKSGLVLKVGDVDGIVTALSKIDFKSEDCIKQAMKYEKSVQYGKYINIYQSILE